MSQIKLKNFAGLRPRTGEQVLPPGTAVRATNTDLDSGALRPLIAPHLEHVFPRAGEPGFLSPNPVDPSTPGPVDPTDPSGPGPEPPNCVPVEIVTGPSDFSANFGVDEVVMSVAINQDASLPVVIRWYVDDILQTGETGTTISIDPNALNAEYNNGELVLSPNTPVLTRLYGIVRVEVSNPCGFAEARATISIENDYKCDAYELTALALAESYWPMDDPTYMVSHPEVYRKLTTENDAGYELRFNPSLAGGGWGGTVSQKTVTGIDVCTSPYKIIHRKDTGIEPNPFGFFITPSPWIGAEKPYVDFTCIAVGTQHGSFVYADGKAVIVYNSGASSATISSRFQLNVGRGGTAGAYTYKMQIGHGSGPFPFQEIPLADNLFDTEPVHFVHFRASQTLVIQGGDVIARLNWNLQVNEQIFSGVGDAALASGLSGIVSADWNLPGTLAQNIRFMERSPDMAWLGLAWGADPVVLYQAFLNNFRD